MRFKCDICDNDLIQESIAFPTYKVVVCSNCQYGRVDPLPDQETLGKLYDSAQYYDSHMNYDFNNISDEEIEEKIEKSRVLHQGNFAKFGVNLSGNLLEIGSGGGFALKAFSRMGLSVSGLEMSKSAVSFCHDRLNLNVYHTSLEKSTLRETFDFILLNHVLEHFVDVRSAMAKIVEYLAPEGVLYIRVPDHNSYDRRKYGVNWPAYAYYHISNFSEISLTLLFDQFGLKPMGFHRFMSEQTPMIIKTIAKGPLRDIMTKYFSGRSITAMAKRV